MSTMESIEVEISRHHHFLSELQIPAFQHLLIQTILHLHYLNLYYEASFLNLVSKKYSLNKDKGMILFINDININSTHIVVII